MSKNNLEMKRKLPAIIPSVMRKAIINCRQTTGFLVLAAVLVLGAGGGTTVFGQIPFLSINDVSQNEGNSVSITVPAPLGGVSFDIATANGTAVAPAE